VANANPVAENQFNDVWGFQHSSGVEYAILGGNANVWIYSLANPAAPQLVAQVPGQQSTVWRDMKNYGDYIYAVSDNTSEGILIIDLTQPQNSITWSFWKPHLTINGITRQLLRAHNLFIDEQGRCYLSGSNLAGGGVLAFDVATTPGSPAFLGAASTIYSHDNFVRGDTVWSADIYAGVFSVLDVSNIANPQLKATHPTSRAFAHNCWLSDDGKYLFTTDERSNAYVDAYDITDLDNIELLDKYRPLATEGTGVIPHNVHYYDGYLVISHYSDGIKVVDASRPDNLIEVGGYDTDGDAGTGFVGSWGAFPYLPSGLILASDQNHGLFVLHPTYRRACYLEGMVSDASNSLPLVGVDVSILSSQVNRGTTYANGSYKTGQEQPGPFEVVFSKAGYHPDTISVYLQNGVVTNRNVALAPDRSNAVTGVVARADDRTGAPAQVMLYNAKQTYTTLADHNGAFSFADVAEGTYDLIAGTWGYRQQLLPLQINDGANEIDTLLLEAGYEDDFVLDLGWTVSSTAASGTWERGKPVPSDYDGLPAHPDMDLPDDAGEACFVTGNTNGSGDNAPNDDVDAGNTVLTSPLMDLTGYTDPTLNYGIWFFSEGITLPDDTLYVRISNGDTMVTVDTVTTTTSTWIYRSCLPLSEAIPLTTTMQLTVDVHDQGTDHVVDAAFDRFAIEEATATICQELNGFCVATDTTITGTPEDGPLRIAQTITTAGSVVIDFTKNVTWQAGQTLTLSPGFHAQGTFSARIADCQSFLNESPNTPRTSLPPIREAPQATALPGDITIRIVPNPVQHETTIQYNLNTATRVNLSIYDLQGKEKVVLLRDALRRAGWQQERFIPAHLADGLYLVVLRTNTGIKTEKLLISK